MTKEKFQVVRRAGTLILLAVLVWCIHIKADAWPLVLEGDPIPNTANFRFTTFGQAVVDTSGTIAFKAGFVDPSTNSTGVGIFEIKGGQLLPVMMEGQALPDIPGSAFGPALGDPSINNSGDIVFVASTNERPGQTFKGIFEQSGGVLRRVVDFATPPPGAPGETFASFGPPQINDQGQIVFLAGLTSNASGMVPVQSGVFSMSSAGLQPVALGGDPSSLNNRGDILLYSGGLSINSGGSITPVVSFPLTVPGTNYTATGLTGAALNDDQNVVFVSTTNLQIGRGSAVVSDGVVRWRSGTLSKVVSAGDPVPGFSGATFEEFLYPHVNESAAIFVSRRLTANNQVGLIGRASPDGQLSILATEDQFVDGIGTLDGIAFPNFDTQQGPLVTFLAGAAARTESGIYAATAAQQYTLRFPQIADGGGSTSGGWRTTFVLANRSTTAANATISFYADTGAPHSLAVGGIQQTQTTVVVPALGVAQVQTQGGGPLTAGWALVQSDQNLTGIATYGLLDGSGNTVAEVGVPASLALNSMSVFAENGATTSTGVALANPNNTAANVTLTLKDSNSTQLAQTSVTIPPMGHLAAYANQLFSAIPTREFQGKIEVLSTQPLAGITLRQRASVFTSLPIIP